MTKPEIIGSERSTYTRAVRMVCDEKGIDHVLTEQWLGAPEIAAIHPLGKMPVLRHGAVELFESKAIATYLYAYIAPKGPDGTPDRTAIEAVMPDVHEQLAILDRAVAATGHLVDDEFTFADINLLPILFYIRRTPEGGEALAAARHLSAYYDAHAARPSFARTVPPVRPPRRAKPD